MRFLGRKWQKINATAKIRGNESVASPSTSALAMTDKHAGAGWGFPIAFPYKICKDSYG
jgi:hypothetical protein